MLTDRATIKVKMEDGHEAPYKPNICKKRGWIKLSLLYLTVKLCCESLMALGPLIS